MKKVLILIALLAAADSHADVKLCTKKTKAESLSDAKNACKSGSPALTAMECYSAALYCSAAFNYNGYDYSASFVNTQLPCQPGGTITNAMCEYVKSDLCDELQ